jgi:hydroxylamine dehydrogenase
MPTLPVLTILLSVLLPGDRSAPSNAGPQVSPESETCIECHEQYTPGIVADWRSSRHATVTPDSAMTGPEIERRISASTLPPSLRGNVVGCYECHALNGARHTDNFEHFGFRINVIVSPADCQSCHPAEVEQYARGKKPHALDILEKNSIYHLLVETILTTQGTPPAAHNNSKSEACYACHGTRVEVKGTRTVATDAGDVEVPHLTNWPNQGVGRINPDGSSGSCAACHPRHSFSIAIARKPFTCGQCHLEPDVPAYNVYKESKHGNIMESMSENWAWEKVPWTVGKDFTAPTCAACHTSLLTGSGGSILAERSHDFGARTWVRIFGLIYSHPQPKDGRTYLITNADKLPLPTTFAGVPASTFLISAEEQGSRQTKMRKVCSGCHSSSWSAGHFARFDSTVADADRMTLAATGLLATAWEKKLADRTNPFDEELEQQWVRQWLFYANSVRHASAMSGPDYAAFKNGWWNLTENLQEMEEEIKAKTNTAGERH